MSSQISFVGFGSRTRKWKDRLWGRFLGSKTPLLESVYGTSNCAISRLYFSSVLWILSVLDISVAYLTVISQFVIFSILFSVYYRSVLHLLCYIVVLFNFVHPDVHVWYIEPFIHQLTISSLLRRTVFLRKKVFSLIYEKKCFLYLAFYA